MSAAASEAMSASPIRSMCGHALIERQDELAEVPYLIPEERVVLIHSVIHPICPLSRGLPPPRSALRRASAVRGLAGSDLGSGTVKPALHRIALRRSSARAVRGHPLGAAGVARRDAAVPVAAVPAETGGSDRTITFGLPTGWYGRWHGHGAEVRAEASERTELDHRDGDGRLPRRRGRGAVLHRCRRDPHRADPLLRRRDVRHRDGLSPAADPPQLQDATSGSNTC